MQVRDLFNRLQGTPTFTDIVWKFLVFRFKLNMNSV